jgi:beta-glucosidase
MRVFDPYRPGLPIDRWLAALGTYLFNRCLLLTLLDGKLRFPFGRGQYLPEVAGSTDFLGLNYYTRDTVGFQPRQPRLLFGGAFPARGERSLAGWEIYPEGMYRLLKFLQPLGRPIVITENGVADESDELRPRFLLNHLVQLYRAIGEGIPVRGYFHWSSMDNFEWADGLRLRFGLIHVDFETQKRTVKPSGWLYSDVCARGGISVKQIQRYAPEVLKAAHLLPKPLLGPEGALSTEPGA